MTVNRCRATNALIESLPSPEKVREDLARALREASVLRRLLKTCEAASKKRAMEVAHAG